MSRYLATERVLKQKTAGLPNWERRSTSRELGQEEINREVENLLKDRDLKELNDITRLVYGLLRYETERDRIIPLLKEMGRDWNANEEK